MPILFKLNRLNLSLGSFRRKGVPPPMRGFIPLPGTQFIITGVTRDSAGTALGLCQVQLFRTDNDALIAEVQSDASGNYRFSGASVGVSYYLVAYLTGSPDVFGTTVNTLVAA